jgi:hypothetical protein
MLDSVTFALKISKEAAKRAPPSIPYLVTRLSIAYAEREILARGLRQKSAMRFSGARGKRPLERIRTYTPAVLCLGLVGVLSNPACSGNGGSVGSGGEQTGQSCSQASQCFPTLPAGAIRGQVTCLTQLQTGYCTHTCKSDSDCCAISGECTTGIKEICAPFESTGQMYCFLSCAPSDVLSSADGGPLDPGVFCQQWANPAFTCRSTGGGSNNRKFCGP